ncbi:hypothetical protein, partial [Pseudactinotalea sp.]|uniref:hypothetical protein n=1 Tax=Pseudactinotalea sp. TaxID=1926260 RepID=UPI003B3BA137
HDASPNRTSQTTGLPDVSAMTWAQLQTYQNTLNSAGTPRPYYRLVDFLDAFTPTHVVVVDNKTNTAQSTFLDLLDAHGGNTKIVVKAYGVGTGGGVASAAAARGYRTWGYFYESDLPNIPTAQTGWSILGMEYTASASTWSQMLTYGKPVVSHIIQSQANYDTAAAKGARMAQVANVASVTAVGASSIGAVGRLTLSGTATRGIEVRRSAGGFLQVSGSGFRTVRVDRVADGALAVSGSGDRTLGVSRTAVGALTVDGSAAVSTGITRSATGILTLHGQGEVSSEAVSRSATGYLTLAGVAAATVAVVRSAVGVLVLTGTGAIVRPSPEVPEVLTLTAIPVAHTLTPEITRRTLEDA